MRYAGFSFPDDGETYDRIVDLHEQMSAAGKSDEEISAACIRMLTLLAASDETVH